MLRASLEGLLLPTRASRDLPTSGETGSACVSRRLLLPTRASRGLPPSGQASSGSYSPPALRAASPQVGRRYSDRPMALVTKVTGAESVRWDLSDLFRSPTDPAIEATLADA